MFKSAVVSIVFIFLIHYLVKFLKNTLTSPKIKDFVTLPAQKYERMFNTINQGDRTLPVESATDMKSELKNFLKNHMEHTPKSGDDNLAPNLNDNTPVIKLGDNKIQDFGFGRDSFSSFSDF